MYTSEPNTALSEKDTEPQADDAVSQTATVVLTNGTNDAPLWKSLTFYLAIVFLLFSSYTLILELTLYVHWRIPDFGDILNYSSIPSAFIALVFFYVSYPYKSRTVNTGVVISWLILLIWVILIFLR